MRACNRALSFLFIYKLIVMLTDNQKKIILLDVINNGLFYRPVVQWDEYGEPYVAYLENFDPAFSSLSELANAMRQLADDIER